MSKTKPIHAIVATDLYGTIGHGSKMPEWVIDDDFKMNFTPKTKEGGICIMGSITAMSLKGPLPKRICIAITTNPETAEHLHEKGFKIAQNPWEALAMAQKIPEGDTIWNIGGGKLYQWARENVIVKELHVTRIQSTYKGEDEIKFCGYPVDQYTLDPSRSLYFKKRPAGTNGEKDKGNSDDAIVEVYVREY